MTKAVLVLSAILLACNCSGLLLVRIYSPPLRGLRWLGGSFAVGALSAIFFLYRDQTESSNSGLLGNSFVVLAFVLLHAAVLDLTESSSLISPLSMIIVAAQIISTIYVVLFQQSASLFKTQLYVFLISVQAVSTSLRLLRSTSDKERAPAYFTASLLAVFAALNSTSIILDFSNKDFAAGLLTSPTRDVLSYGLFIVVALGVAFGFFWMTTANLAADLTHLASTDPLTRLYTRRVFLQWCEKELFRSREHGTLFSILVIDLDHFKNINDRFGHQAGDRVLCSAVERIQDGLRGIDVIGRWGGEEFVVLLPNASSSDATMVADRVRRNIGKVVLPELQVTHVGSVNLYVTASIGISTNISGLDTIEQMIDRADRALYQAKAAGRNAVVSSTIVLA